MVSIIKAVVAPGNGGGGGGGSSGNPPVITSNGGGSTAALSIAENTGTVTTVTATSTQALVYSIVGGADAAKFAINSATGVLSFIAAPDFENPGDSGANNVYDVTVRASNGLGSDDQAISVTVTNVNEPPVITSDGGGATAAITVNENTKLVTNVLAIDPEGAGTIVYSIAGGADAAKFQIDPDTGRLTFATTPNFETPTDSGLNNVYDVIVRASDGTLVDTQAIAVTVANVNEPPLITSNGGGDTAAISLAENTTAVTKVTASDVDAGTTLVYSIVGGADAAKFAIDAATGVLSFKAAPDFDIAGDVGANNVYDVIVRASDGALSDDQAIAVTVTNVNEAPVISSNGGGAAAAISIAENTTAVTKVTASDADAGTTITYSIAGGADAAKFAIDAATGALSFKAAPDFDIAGDVGANNVYDVIVRASDGALTDDQAIAVTVTNVAEAPVIGSNGGGAAAAISVAENTTAVTTVSATDSDAGTTITYSIVGGADAAKFAIDAATGALSFKAAPDYEFTTDTNLNNVYNVTVRASDGTLFDDQALAVTVTNVNEAPVILSNGGGASASLSVAENTTAVTTVVGGDPELDVVTYSIVGGADAAKFTINAKSGALAFITAPNFEAAGDAGANNVYDVIVRASSFGGLVDDQALAVAVTNVNEFAPVISSNGGGASAAISVAENKAAVTTIRAADQDQGAVVTYSIVGGADAAQFVINSATGALAFIGAPDFELSADAGANNVYDVIVRASDGTLFDDQALAVTVTNVNEAPAIDSNGGGSKAAISVAENTTAVTTVHATDPDFTVPTYSIVGGTDAARFAIDATTGALTFIAAPNFEAPGDVGRNNIYSVIVRASDGTLKDDQALAITVTNVHDLAPVITSLKGQDKVTHILENTTFVMTVTAKDRDGGGPITFSIAGGVDAARFAIDPTSGALSFVAAPDFEKPDDVGKNNTYDVIVRASQGTFFDDQALKVFVDNNNEFAPIIDSNGGGDVGKISIAENTKSVSKVSATDQDGGISLVSQIKVVDGRTIIISEYKFVGTEIIYSISGGADAAKFAIDSKTGALSFVAAPDFEAPGDVGKDNVYDVIVRASDGSLATSRFDEQALAVTVTDVVATPVITSNGGGAAAAITRPENMTDVTTVSATHPDSTSPATVYSIAGGADAARFVIDAATGALSFKVAPNFEAPGDVGADNVYDVVVRASSGTLFDNQALAVTIIDASENVPVITSNGGGAAAAITMDENTTFVATVKATDADPGTVLDYSIAGGADANKFVIDDKTGVLSFAARPDFEAPADAGANNVYDVIVRASDGLLSDTQKLAISITDVLDTITGTQGKDVIDAPAGAFWTINGLDGDDILKGNSGTDTINGGDGNDTLYGGAGDDTLNGDNGFNILIGGPGNDTLIGGPKDTASYEDANARVIVSLAITGPQNTNAAGIDTLVGIGNLTGSRFGDVLTGNSMANTLAGGDGDDTIRGGAGDDILMGGLGNNVLIGGTGFDTASYADATSGVTVTLLDSPTLPKPADRHGDYFQSIEALEGSQFDDTLKAGAVGVHLSGGYGNDTLVGGAGADTLFGGQGNDTLTGGAGADIFQLISRDDFDMSDTFTDFTPGTDKIQINPIYFDIEGGIKGTTLPEKAFSIGTHATNPDQHFIFNPADGTLFYDRDGSGLTSPYMLAHLVGVTTLSYTDFVYT